jgi:LuxR family maltose regulon positive regulatory protein
LELGEPEGFISIFVEEGKPIAEALTNLLKQDRLWTVQPAYVKNILAALARSQPPGATREGQPASILPAGTGPVAQGELASLIEPLTDRELDVLRLMAEGLKYEEIAERLFISLNTVRSHVKTIYDKLDVKNRTKAIEMARHLHLL